MSPPMSNPLAPIEERRALIEQAIMRANTSMTEATVRRIQDELAPLPVEPRRVEWDYIAPSTAMKAGAVVRYAVSCQVRADQRQWLTFETADKPNYECLVDKAFFALGTSPENCISLARVVLDLLDAAPAYESVGFVNRYNDGYSGSILHSAEEAHAGNNARAYDRALEPAVELFRAAPTRRGA